MLITGAAGFVGANLARRLLTEGHEVHVVLPPSGRRWRLEEISGDLRPVNADLRDGEATEQAVEAVRPDWVFHLATHGAYSYQTDLHRIVQTNINGTINLLQACIKAGVETVVNTGSSSEYGYKDHAPAETEALEPNSHYSWTKAGATHFCRFTATTCNVHIPTLRLYSVYGPFEEPGRLMPTLIVKGTAGELPNLVDPATSRDFVYIDDVCDAYLLAAVPGTERGPVYNVGSGVQTTLADLVEVAKKRLDIAAEPQWGAMKSRSWDTEVWVADSRKISSELGWTARHSLEEGFDRFVHWYSDNPQHQEHYH